MSQYIQNISLKTSREDMNLGDLGMDIREILKWILNKV
jgi:hypothetical protein